eukprot:349306-Hanusia_phi.AAC.1
MAGSLNTRTVLNAQRVRSPAAVLPGFLLLLPRSILPVTSRRRNVARRLVGFKLPCRTVGVHVTE